MPSRGSSEAFRLPTVNSKGLAVLKMDIHQSEGPKGCVKVDVIQRKRGG